MQTDLVIVNPSAFQGVLGMLANYDRAVSGAQAGLEVNSDEWATAGTDAAILFCADPDASIAEVLDAAGTRRIIAKIVPPGSEATGTPQEIGAERGSFSQIESVCRALQERPEEASRVPALQANLTSADGQYQFQFVIASPADEPAEG